MTTVDEPRSAIQAEAVWQSGTASSGRRISSPPIDDRDLGVALRTVLDLARPHPGDAGIRVDLFGTFGTRPCGLVLKPPEVEELADLRLELHISIALDVDAHEAFIRGTEPEERASEYLTPRGVTPEIEVQFGIFDFQASEEAITREIGIVPSWFTSPRKPFTKGGEPLPSQWIVSSGRERTLNFEPLIERVMGQLGGREEPVAALIRGGATSRLDLVVHYYSDLLPQFALRPALWTQLRALRAGFWFDAV